MCLDNLYIKNIYIDDTQMTSIDLDAERFMFVSRDYIKTNKRTIKFDDIENVTICDLDVIGLNQLQIKLATGENILINTTIIIAWRYYHLIKAHINGTIIICDVTIPIAAIESVFVYPHGDWAVIKVKCKSKIKNNKVDAYGCDELKFNTSKIYAKEIRRLAKMLLLKGNREEYNPS